MPHTSTERRVAVVTGAGRGLGRAEALDLASRGFAVVVNDWDEGTTANTGPLADQVVREIIARGGDAISNHNDVADILGAQAMVEAAADRYGRVDVLVNNAGIHRSEPFASMPAATFDEVLRVCLNGHIEPARAMAGWWLRDEDGRQCDAVRRIINTTSLAGLYGASSGTTAYATAKAAVIGMTWSLSRELSHMGATVNAIAPRAATRMTETKPKFQVPETRDRFAPERVAPFVSWIASPASAALTGRIFVVGGSRVWLVRPFEAFGPYELNESLSQDSLPMPAPDWEIQGSAVPTWTDIELRYA